MSETDKEFVADMEWLHSHDREAALPPEKLIRLFALARRGAEAADEIERLTEERDRQYNYNAEIIAKYAALEAVSERLRAALRKIASNSQQRSNCFCGACVQARAACAALDDKP